MRHNRHPLRRIALTALLGAAWLAGPAVASAAARERIKIVVMDLKVADADKTVAETFSQLVSAELSRLKLFEVLSYAEMRELLKLEEDRQMMGCDAEESCLAELRDALGVQRLVSGNLKTVEDKTILSLVYTDTKRVKVLKRVTRQAPRRALIEQIGPVVRELVEPDLSGATVPVAFVVSENGAEISIDERLVGISPLATQALTVGAHAARVTKTGFIDFATTVELEPDQPHTVRVDLFPSPEFVADYQSKAQLYRGLAWGSTALAGAAVVVASIFGYRYTEDVDRYDSLDRQRLADPNFEKLPRATYSKMFDDNIDSIDQNRAVIYAAVGTAVVGAGLALYFFLAGDDPGRYDQYAAGAEPPPAP